jgi:hypothetical protein
MNSAPQGGFPQGGPPGGISGMGGRGGFLPGGPFASIILVALFVVTLIVLAIAFYRLYQKAGFSGALGLLMVVPVVNLGVALYLAFAEWPVIAELAQAKLLAASASQQPAAAPPASAPVPDGAEPAIPLTT